jgi:hypothetical protein
VLVTFLEHERAQRDKTPQIKARAGSSTARR